LAKRRILALIVLTVQIFKTSRAEPDLDLLLDFNWTVMAPSDAAEEQRRTGIYSIALEGFALGRRKPVVRVDVVNNGRVVKVMPTGVKRSDLVSLYPGSPDAALSGFEGNFNALRVTPEFELTLEAVFDDGFVKKLGTLEGRRDELRSDHEPRLQPLMITTHGRSGSSLLLRALGSHPQVVAYKPFLAEPRVATYWSDVLQALGDPESYFRQISPFGDLAGNWWLGEGAPGFPVTRDVVAEEWLEAEGIRTLTTFCQSRIDSFYALVSRHSGRSEAVYFAEKCAPSGLNPLPSLLSEIYSGSREIFLVRDFRDMISSMFAYSEKLQAQADGGTPAAFALDRAHEEVFGRIWKENVALLLENWRDRSDSAHLVRYEDLVRWPTEIIEDLVKYLGIDDCPSSIESMQKGLSEESDQSDWHKTTPGPEQSIGRWKRDLSPALREATEELFGEALEAFGYRD
jgi:hypothetical protein